MSDSSSAAAIPPGAGQRPERLKRKRRQYPQAGSSRVDREALRAVLSPEGFREIEKLYDEFLPSGGCEEFFWRFARESMVESAQKRPDGPTKIMRAKVAAVGAFLGLPAESIARLVQQVDLPRFAAAAAANLSIREFQQEPQFRDLWSGRILRTNPPLRVEFDHVVVFGSINEAGDIAKNKSWGVLIGIEPLRADDRLLPRNITYILKATSKQRMRWEFRDTFRNILGNRRPLVSEALRSTKRCFLKGLSDGDAKVIRNWLDLAPDEFWRMVRYGERFGPDGIVAFVSRLEEKTKGYALPFPQSNQGLVQIYPANSPELSMSMTGLQ
jgi:hypothetical protein